jgi:biotin carboxylase
VSRALVDKHVQRLRLRDHGVDSLRFAHISTLSEAAVAWTRVGPPAVIKPRRGAGSRNTVLVRTRDECLEAAAAAFRYGERALVLEEYLEGDSCAAGASWGDYVSVESVAVGDDILHLGVTGKPPLAEPFRETGAFFPSTLSPSATGLVLGLTTAALRALGVSTGVCHTELKLTCAGPRVIEVNGRLGGYVNDVVRRSTGASVLRVALETALDRSTDVVPPTPHRVAYQLFMVPPVWARSVRGISGVDRVRSLPGVRRVELTRAPGDAVDWRLGTASSIGTVYGDADDHLAMEAVKRSIAETLVIDYAG